MTSLPSVFISYSSKDIKIVEAIENHLIENGFDDNVWRDKRKIETDWSKEIVDALENSDIVLLIWTSNSKESKMVKQEWLTARALRKVIQIAVVNTEIPIELPEPLVNLQAISLGKINTVNKNIENIENLITSIKNIKDFTYNDYDYKILPNKRHISLEPNSNFTGRDKELVELYFKIIGELNKQNVKRLGIVGMGGLCKTQLAVELAYRFAYQFEKGIYWIQGMEPKTWSQQIIEISKNHLGLKIPNPDSKPEDQDKQYFIEFQKYCSMNGKSMLLVIDNVIDPLVLNDDSVLFPNTLNMLYPAILNIGCNIIFTTRKNFIDRLPGTEEYKIPVLTPQLSYSLLSKYCKPLSKDDEKYANMICNRVGYLPLAIVLIGSFLRMYSSSKELTFEEYYRARK